jgi:uncharacterized membrane protein YfcA
MSRFAVTARHLQGFSIALFVATFGGLVGLGGAEFRLPLLKGWFKMASLKAVIFNKATSLAVVFFALLFRAHEIPFSRLSAYGGLILNLLSGSLVGFFRYSRGAAFEVLREERALLWAMLIGSIAGAGALMLGMVDTDILVLMLSFLLMASALKIFKHRKDNDR